MSSLVVLGPERLRQLLGDLAAGRSAAGDEAAVPSYLHRNPLVRWIVWRRLGAVLALAGAGPLGGAVLDFGSGSGAFLPTLCATAREVWATDLDLRYTEALVARAGLPVRTVAPDRLVERLGRGSLSLAVAVEVLEHMDDAGPWLATLGALLAPGGRLVVSAPTESAVYRLCRAVAGFRGDYHKNRADGVFAAVERAGFRALGERRLPFQVGPSLFVVRAYERASPAEACLATSTTAAGVTAPRAS